MSRPPECFLLVEECPHGGKDLVLVVSGPRGCETVLIPSRCSCKDSEGFKRLAEWRLDAGRLEEIGEAFKRAAEEAL